MRRKAQQSEKITQCMKQFMLTYFSAVQSEMLFLCLFFKFMQYLTFSTNKWLIDSGN